MAASYREFLVSPNSAVLADTATLHYVTTTTTFSGSTAIIKHLSALQRQVKKKKQDVMNLIDGGDTLAVEVDTALEFLTSGGTYLPGLDDNFLSDRVAYLSIMHIVKIDSNGKISQIRLQWDQGSLLKQLEMIGVSGRNWPIRDSREQLSMIQSCVKSVGPAAVPSQDHNDVVIRTRGTSTNAMRDPHASLQLFGTREEIEAAPATAVVSPYAGHRPNQRSLADLLGNDSAPDSNQNRPASPSKRGQGSNHQRMRLFDGQNQGEESDVPKPSQYIRPNPNKYSHFQFSDGSEDVPQAAKAAEERPKSKHASQWSFEDFTTPHKSQTTKGAVRPPDARNWNEESTEQVEKPLGKGRRDAETHFELKDDGERVVHHDQQGARARGSANNNGHGLYKNNLFQQEDDGADANRALGNITNLKDRGKDFDAHFSITDNSPSHAQPERQQNVPEARKRAIQMMDSSWSTHDQSPSQKENKPQAENSRGNQGGIHIAGDGMGGKKGSNRNWMHGGDDEQAPKPAAGRKGNQTAQKSVWGF